MAIADWPTLSYDPYVYPVTSQTFTFPAPCIHKDGLDDLNEQLDEQTLIFVEVLDLLRSGRFRKAIKKITKHLGECIDVEEKS